jgi:hypothetical protein
MITTALFLIASAVCAIAAAGVAIVTYHKTFKKNAN